MVETAALGDFVEAVGCATASVLPGVLGDVVRTLAGGAGSLVDLEPSAPGLVRLGVRSGLPSFKLHGIGASVLTP